ncbi:hypothetical protein EVA_17941, partial [gut metagenome]
MEYDDVLNSTNYKQAKVSDAMSLSVTITPLQGWDIIAEIKGRLNVENNNFSMGYPKMTLPGGKIVTT